MFWVFLLSLLLHMPGVSSKKGVKIKFLGNKKDLCAATIPFCRLLIVWERITLSHFWAAQGWSGTLF